MFDPAPLAAAAVPEAADLHDRTGLPEAYLFLVREFPRSEWTTARLHAGARFWLERHAGFRGAHARLVAGGARWRETGGDPAAYARETLPALGGFLQHLDGHHRVESDHYFPAMRRQEPRLDAGFALLDRDHDAIHRVLEGLMEAAVALSRAAAGDERRAAAERLAGVIEGAGRPLLRHLDDEEDIVVPMLTRYGDPLGLG